MLARAAVAMRAASAQSRGLHASAPRAAGGYDYLHAKYMYTLRDKPFSKPGAFVAIFGAVAVGVGIPIFAVTFQQKKAGLM